MAAIVRRIRAGEGRLLRDIRLRALSDAPGAFASTFEEESKLELSTWEAASRERARGSTTVNFVAESELGIVGLVGAFFEEGSAQLASVHLVSMWVDPAARGQGLGSRLVEAVVEWAADAGAGEIALWVARGNEAAAALYRRSGFVETKDVQPLPSDPCRTEIRMVRRLAHASGASEFAPAADA